MRGFMATAPFRLVWSGSVTTREVVTAAGTRILALTLALSVAFGPTVSGPALKRMADGKLVDDRQPPSRDALVLLLQRYGGELRAIWPPLHVGGGAAGVPVDGSWMAATS